MAAEPPSAAPWLDAAVPAEPVRTEVDAEGLLCPLPLVRLGAALREADPGDLLLVRATDSGFFPDLLRWIRVRRAELVALREQEGPPCRYLAWVRAG